MRKFRIVDYRVEIGDRFAISFQRTLRIPDDGNVYPLPPTLGAFPVKRVDDFAEKLPPAWEKAGGVFIPMYQREAMWLAFEAQTWKPNAVKIGVGDVDALTGGDWDERLQADPQNYIVCPNQPWLDGINVGDGLIRQFVAMPLGEGTTIEGQLTGEERVGGLQFLVYEPIPGQFPDQQPRNRISTVNDQGAPLAFAVMPEGPQEMGLAAGGQMEQKIYPDPYGIETWDQKEPGMLNVHIVNSAQYQRITGQLPPPSPISAHTYTKHGLPWFSIYDEEEKTLDSTERLKGVKSLSQIRGNRGLPPDDEDEPTEIGSDQTETVDPGLGRQNAAE